jgi:hypothetical protein
VGHAVLTEARNNLVGKYQRRTLVRTRSRYQDISNVDLKETESEVGWNTFLYLGQFGISKILIQFPYTCAVD